MSRAEDLFARLRARKVAALEEMIAERELESLFLDFKRSPADGAAAHLAPEDNKNLSKSIAGFANSSGGVVIWGVDCRRDSASGNEVADKRPLVNAGGFATKIQNAISRVTIPPHPGVQVEFFDEPGVSPSGYVAVFIPQSTFGPVRSVATNHYHLRSGSDFGIVPHDVLAGMFGRAPQPEADVNIVTYPARLDSKPGHLTLALGIFAVNLGGVVAERPYLSVAFGDLPGTQIVGQCPDPQSFSLRRGLLPVFSVVSSPHVVLTPGSSEHVCNIVIEIPREQIRGIEITCTMGVVGAVPRRFTLRASESSLREALELAAQRTVQTTDILTFQPLS